MNGGEITEGHGGLRGEGFGGLREGVPCGVEGWPVAPEGMVDGIQGTTSI